MNKFATLLALAMALTPAQWEKPKEEALPNPELLRQEIINLEREAAHAIQLGNTTFFSRVYSDDFSGVLSGGQPVNKQLLLAAVQTAEVKYESFDASDIKVRVYRDTAIATCLWSVRAIANGKKTNGQMRVLHVYLYGHGGYRVVASQTTLLPASAQQPL
jgi:ketosteroid isomerase-like protein